MARAKKKEVLSLEEKLEQALVPVEEQPYEVPENWCWLSGKAIFKKQENQKPQGDIFRYIDIESIDNENQVVFEPKEILVSKAPSRASRKLHIGDTIFSLVRPYLMNIAYIDEVLADCIASTGFYVCTPCDMINGRYIYHLMRSPYVVNGLNIFMKGDNSPSIRKNDIENFLYPIPPIAEQQRIVEQIESLFGKLDEVEEKILKVKESCLARKAAILSQAFNGKLTTMWRKKNDIGEDWIKKTFDEVAIIRSNLVEPKEYQDFPHIAPDNIEKRTGRLLQYNTIAEDGVKSGKHRFYSGQILYSKIRPYLSKVVMVNFDGLCSADMYPIEAKEDAKYLWYYMLSDEFLEQASTAGSRSVLPKINQKELAKLIVNIPSIEEQEEIVKILDKLFVDEQRVVEYIQKVLEEIGIMKKAILAKAFRGELGTNNPDEEKAIELLK